MIRPLVHALASLFPNMSKTQKACLIIVLIIAGLIVAISVPLMVQ